MYYDRSQECAVLRTGDSVYPRDLALNIFQGWCSRLTSWSHPSLGKPFMMELARDLHSTKDIDLAELSSDRNTYTFESTTTKISHVLDESNRLPTIFSLKGGDGARVKSVTVTRYNEEISGVDFSGLWDCINVCQAVADRRGLLLGEAMTELAILDLINPINCRKLTTIYTENGMKDGREVCKSPPTNISSVAELNEQMAYLLSPRQPYRTLSARITANIEDSGIVDIPTNRGLSVFVDTDNAGGAAFNATQFNVSWLAELYLEGAILNGSTSISIEEEGLTEISGCNISHKSALPPFLSNAGEAIFTSVSIMDSTKLENIREGLLDLTYVEFLDKSTLENSAEGRMELSRLQMYETFTLPLRTTPQGSRSGAIVMSYREPSQKSPSGDVILEEATRLYNTVDDETDLLCLGNDAPDLTLQLSSTECIDRCEDEFVCSGVLVYFDEDNKAQCDLCLRDTDCLFDCSAVNSVYYKPSSKSVLDSTSAIHFIIT
mmetsp:Transcript_10861/g.19748  ORF Transcript_10861/g.19748 Transcript_10861/m.19748 type:complete len:492 (-) Transcript_10861:30-1505(-)